MFGRVAIETALEDSGKTVVLLVCVKKIADGGSRNHGRLGQVGTASGGHVVDGVDIRAIYCVQYYLISKDISMHTTHKRHQCYERACVNAQRHQGAHAHAPLTMTSSIHTLFLWIPMQM